LPQKGLGIANIGGVSTSNTQRSFNTGTHDTKSLFDGLNVTSKIEPEKNISTAPVPILSTEKASIAPNSKNNNSNNISQLMAMTPAPVMKSNADKLLPSPNELLIDTDSFSTTQTAKPSSNIPYDSNPFGTADDIVPLASGNSNPFIMAHKPLPPPKETKRLSSSQNLAHADDKPIKQSVDPFATAAAVSIPPKVSSAPKSLPPQDTVFAVALYSRTAEGPTELTITEGETLLVIKQDSEWWYGSTMGAQTKFGYFPGNYVKLTNELPPPPSKAVPMENVQNRRESARVEHSNAFGTTVQKEDTSKTKLYANPMKMSAKAKALAAAGKTLQNNDLVVNNSCISATPTGINIRDLGLNGMRYMMEIKGPENTLIPVWHHPFFVDLFAEGYKHKIVENDDANRSIPAIKRLGVACDAISQAMRHIPASQQLYQELMDTVSKATYIFKECAEMCDQIPVHCDDPVKFYTFLIMFMTKIKSLKPGDRMMVPSSWPNEEGVEHAVILLLERDEDDYQNSDTVASTFTVTVINTGRASYKGLGYHPYSVDPVHGAIIYCQSIVLKKVAEDKIRNSTFWMLVFKSAVNSAEAEKAAKPQMRPSAKFFYEKLLPFLTNMPVLSAVEIPSDEDFKDFLEPPFNGDNTFINAVLECLRSMGRQAGLSFPQSLHLPMLVRWSMLKITLNDMYVAKSISMAELDLIKLASTQTAKAAGMQVDSESDATLTVEQAEELLKTIKAVEEKVVTVDEHVTPLPNFGAAADESLNYIGIWEWFGRLRRDVSVEHLAGDAPIPPIMRPIEMTLVPDRVNKFSEVANAMRHCLNLCVLLSNQRKLVHNSYTLRLCMIEHLFVRVIPLPLPITHPRRENECFWHSQPMRYETQADILRLLNMLCRHFATASLSVKITRSGDAIRMLVFSCMATICDATLRKIASDIPAQSSLHYSGRISE
jgi:hypothetical protein